MRIPVILAAVVLGLFTLAAKADTFQTFDLTATFLGAGTVTGTVNLDLSSTSTHDEFDSTADLTYTDGGTTLQFTDYNFSYGDTFNSPYAVTLTFLDSSYTDRLDLTVPVTEEGSLAGFTGGLCTYMTSSSCNYTLADITIGSSYPVGAYSGTFAPDIPPAATPEPGSLALLATGILGLAEPLRRRIRRLA